MEALNTLQRGMKFKLGCENRRRAWRGDSRLQKDGKQRHGRQHGDMGLHRDIQPPGPIIHADRVNVTRGMMELCAYGKHWPFRENERKGRGKARERECVFGAVKSVNDSWASFEQLRSKSQQICLCVHCMTRGLSSSTSSAAVGKCACAGNLP